MIQYTEPQQHALWTLYAVLLLYFMPFVFSLSLHSQLANNGSVFKTNGRPEKMPKIHTQTKAQPAPFHGHGTWIWDMDGLDPGP